VEDAEAQARLQPYLQPSERILWTGRPDPRRLFGLSDLFLVPFSLMWGGFAIVWETLALTSGAPIFFVLWGIPFVVVGQFLIWGRFLALRWDKTRTTYAVTNQRLLILRGRSLQTMFLNQVPTIDQSVRSDGSGTLDFWRSSSRFGYGFGANSGMDVFSGNRRGFAFYDIPDVNQVYRLVNEARTGTG
jgi:hypothetical protein